MKVLQKIKIDRGEVVVKKYKICGITIMENLLF